MRVAVIVPVSQRSNWVAARRMLFITYQKAAARIAAPRA
jgi:hypothetical protein